MSARARSQSRRVRATQIKSKLLTDLRKRSKSVESDPSDRKLSLVWQLACGAQSAKRKGKQSAAAAAAEKSEPTVEVKKQPTLVSRRRRRRQTQLPVAFGVPFGCKTKLLRLLCYLSQRSCRPPLWPNSACKLSASEDHVDCVARESFGVKCRP